MTTVLLIRHGETEWNRRKIFRGIRDVPLNENGRSQARTLADALLPRKIDVAFTSPLSRARETAEIALSGRGIEITVEERLKDFSYGDWTGLERFPFILQENCSLNEFERRRNGYVIRAINDTGHIRRGGGEVLAADF